MELEKILQGSSSAKGKIPLLREIQIENYNFLSLPLEPKYQDLVRQFLYSFADFETVYAILKKGSPWKSVEDCYFALPIFDESAKIENELINAAKDNEKTFTEDGLVTCEKCRKNHVVYFVKQTRSSDEGATVKYKCLDCGNSWVSSG